MHTQTLAAPRRGCCMGRLLPACSARPSSRCGCCPPHPTGSRQMSSATRRGGHLQRRREHCPGRASQDPAQGPLRARAPWPLRAGALVRVRARRPRVRRARVRARVRRARVRAQARVAARAQQLAGRARAGPREPSQPPMPLLDPQGRQRRCQAVGWEGWRRTQLCTRLQRAEAQGALLLAGALRGRAAAAVAVALGVAMPLVSRTQAFRRGSADAGSRSRNARPPGSLRQQQRRQRRPRQRRQR